MLQFNMVQVMQEDDDGNALTTVKPDVAAYYERNVKFSPVNSLDTSILINQNT